MREVGDLQLRPPDGHVLGGELMPRTPGKLGRLPGKVPVGLRDLTFYSAGSLPKPPASVAVPDVANWTMDANTRLGCCGVAGLNHGFMCDAAMTEESETFPSADQVAAYYLTYTDGQDTGVVLSEFLAYVRKEQFFGHTVTAFAPVAVHDVPTLQWAVAAYGFAYTGISVTQAMEQSFGNHQPWQMATLSSTVLGGHCVPAVGYDDQFLYVVTWGEVQAVSWPAWHAMSSEAWAVITGELVAREGDGRGVTLAALRSDLDQLAA